VPDNPRLLRPSSKPTTLTLTNINLLAEDGSNLITESSSYLVLEQQELRTAVPLTTAATTLNLQPPASWSL
jgi:hypothetical protein